MKNTASKFYFLHALSPLHVGVGQGAGVIDLPIAREKATNLPFVPGTAIKGVLREELREHEKVEKNQWEALFGPEKVNDDDSAFAGALLINDAHLLCLPVRSLAGTFAWATCPFILKRYAREAKALGINEKELKKLVTTFEFKDDEALATTNSQLLMPMRDKSMIVLEDLNLKDKPKTASPQRTGSLAADDWAKHIAQTVFADDKTWQQEFIQRFVILPDGVFDFLAETATEIRARVKINHDTRVVEKGALWNEENLPSESLLYGVLYAEQSRKPQHKKDATDMLKTLPSRERLQIGGHATTGRGLVQWVMG